MTLGNWNEPGKFLNWKHKTPLPDARRLPLPLITHIARRNDNTGVRYTLATAACEITESTVACSDRRAAIKTREPQPCRRQSTEMHKAACDAPPDNSRQAIEINTVTATVNSHIPAVAPHPASAMLNAA